MNPFDSLLLGLLRVAFLLLVLSTENTIAHADSVGMTVELTSYILSPEISPDNSCPSSQAFQSEVTSLLGRNPFSSDNPVMRIEVNIKRTKSRYSGTLGSTGSNSSRSFEASTCSELASTIALAIAIAIDPFFVPPASGPPENSDKLPPEETLLPPEESSDTPAFTVEKLTPTPSIPSSKLHWRASLQPSLSIGFTPEVSGVTALGTSIHIGHSSIELSIAATARGQEDFPMGALDAQVFYASLLPCWNPAAFSVCGSMSIGVLRTRGLAPLTNRTRTLRVHSSLGIRSLVSLLDFDGFQMRWFIDGQARITQTTLTVENDQAWTTPALFLMSGLEFSLVLH